MKTYYLLTKPGIIIGNIITTIGGFVLASKGHLDFRLFILTVAGLSLVIASACVFNNYIDRESDKKMARTQNRPLAKGLISGSRALVFASLLGCLGLLILGLTSNALTVCAAATGFLVYVVLYSFLKHHSTYATLVGSVAGAMPPIVGYCAVSNRLDSGALLLFAILVLWQMPHFFSIAMYRSDEYAAASIPVMPIESGNHKTKIHMLLYIIAFIMATLLLLAMGYAGYAYLFTVPLLGFAWLWLCIKGFKTRDDKVWARQMFRLSLVVITGLCGVISFDVIRNESINISTISFFITNIIKLY